MTMRPNLVVTLALSLGLFLPLPAAAQAKRPIPHLALPPSLATAHPVNSNSGKTVPLATPQNPLVYVTVLTALNAGVTDVYQISGGTALLTGTLNEGGGGPVAVDAQQNVYVAQANYDGNFYEEDTPVYEFAPGSSTGTLIFTATGLGAEAMTVGSDGTIYIAGQDFPDTTAFSVVKFSPPDYAPQALPIDSQQTEYPTGISVDSAGNVFVGWYTSMIFPAGPCVYGCVEELAAGKNTWRLLVPDLAANFLAAGAIVQTDGSLVFWTDNPGRFNYVETVPAGKKYPSQVLQLSPTLFPNGGNAVIAMNSDASGLWSTVTGLAASTGTPVYEFNYPAGDEALSFPVNDPQVFFLITGMATSPAYIP
jgi:hypothetical protein